MPWAAAAANLCHRVRWLCRASHRIMDMEYVNMLHECYVNEINQFHATLVALPPLTPLLFSLYFRNIKKKVSVVAD